MIFFRPVQHLSLLFIKILIRRAPFVVGKLPTSTLPIVIRVFSSLFTTTFCLIGTVGFIPTLRVLLLYRSFINRGIINLEQGLKNLNIPLNPVIINTIKNVLLPYWPDLMKYAIGFSRIFNIFLFTISLGIFKPFTKAILFSIRTTVGTIVSAIGILWSDELQSITILKDFACFVKGNIENYGIKIPTLSQVKEEVVEVDNLDITQEGVRWLNVIGLVVLGIAGVVAILCISDIYSPDTIKQVPVVGDIGGIVNSYLSAAFSSVTEFFNSINLFSKGDNPPTVDTTNLPSSPTNLDCPKTNPASPTSPMNTKSILGNLNVQRDHFSGNNAVAANASTNVIPNSVQYQSIGIDTGDSLLEQAFIQFIEENDSVSFDENNTQALMAQYKADPNYAEYFNNIEQWRIKLANYNSSSIGEDSSELKFLLKLKNVLGSNNTSVHPLDSASQMVSPIISTTNNPTMNSSNITLDGIKLERYNNILEYLRTQHTNVETLNISEIIESMDQNYINSLNPKDFNDVILEILMVDCLKIADRKSVV